MKLNQILAAVDLGGLAICVAAGTWLALESSKVTAVGFALGALAFLMSFFLNIMPAIYDDRSRAILQTLTFAAALVILLGFTERMVA